MSLLFPQDVSLSLSFFSFCIFLFFSVGLLKKASVWVVLQGHMMCCFYICKSMECFSFSFCGCFGLFMPGHARLRWLIKHALNVKCHFPSPSVLVSPPSLALRPPSHPFFLWFLIFTLLVSLTPVAVTVISSLNHLHLFYASVFIVPSQPPCAPSLHSSHSAEMNPFVQMSAVFYVNLMLLCVCECMWICGKKESLLCLTFGVCVCTCSFSCSPHRCGWMLFGVVKHKFSHI